MTACNDGPSRPDAKEYPDNGGVIFDGDPRITQMSGIHADAGQRVAFGATLVTNTTADVATLKNATLSGDVSTDDAEIVNMFVHDPQDGQGGQLGAAPWPYQDFPTIVEPLAGHTLEKGEKLAVLFVIDVKKTGAWTWPITRVVYEQDGTTFETSVTFGFQVCPTATETCER